MNNIYEDLNNKQREAVLHTDGPLLVLAGAGSGKTRTLTYRIAYLIQEQGVAPWNILAITFTNKAADEMRTRVNSLVGTGAESIWVSTFHSMCVRILRRDAQEIGFDRNFTIYDADDQKTLIRQVIRKLDLDPKLYQDKAVMNAISHCKDELITPEEYAGLSAGSYRESRYADIYLEYQNQLRRNNAFDFDDLIMKTVELLRDCSDVRERYQEKFRYILVDEYQDTNTAQFRLISLLAGKYRNLCVVGDDDQSIYKFRGANIHNILDFEEVYPDAAVVRLEQNYRSTQNILDVANEVIRNNEGRKEKRLWTENEKGESVRYREYETAQDEAQGVIRDMEEAQSWHGLPLSECAVLYRTNAQSRLLEEACVQYNIPYRLIGGVNFYQRKEIKDILAYLKTVDSARDDMSVQRILNEPRRGIGNVTQNKVTVYAAANDMSFYDALTCAERIPGIGKAAQKIHAFTDFIDSCRRMLESDPDIPALIRYILDASGYSAELDREEPSDAQARRENLNELISKAAEFQNGAEDAALADFLAEVALVADIDSLNPDEDRLTLMTLHGAKGLEFTKVTITGMENGLFPGNGAIHSDNPEDMEEERRLFYVGVTRAKRQLTLTGARARMVNGEYRSCMPSCFIDEIPPLLLEREGERKRQYSSSGYSRSGYGDSDYSDSGYKDSAYSSSGYERSESGEYGYEDSDYRNSLRKGSDYESDFYSDIENDSEKYQDKGHNQDRRGSHSESGRNVKKGGFGGLSESDKVFLGSQLAVKSADGLPYSIGDRVIHSKFGEGTVENIEEQKRDYCVTVNFDKSGVRKMYAAYAKLEKL